MEFKHYLNRHVAPSTADRYEREIDHFFCSNEKKKSDSFDREREVTDPKTATYSQILAYIGERRKHYKNTSSVACTLHAIKHYYSYLVATGQRRDNPARSIRLRDKQRREIQLQDLFTAPELERLMERTERYQLLKNRNKIILSLLIYQGLTNGDIVGLGLEDVDLKEGTVYIKSGGKTNSRTLKLKAKQMYFLLQYLNEDRPKLLKENTNRLIISKLGRAETGEGINYLIETSKHLFLSRNLNPKTIRQSVIANLLKQGKDLRLVQVFAGHKYPSATEKYKQSHLEELKNQVLKFHPLQ